MLHITSMLTLNIKYFLIFTYCITCDHTVFDKTCFKMYFYSKHTTNTISSTSFYINFCFRYIISIILDIDKTIKGKSIKSIKYTNILQNMSYRISQPLARPTLESSHTAGVSFASFSQKSKNTPMHNKIEEEQNNLQTNDNIFNER